MKFSFIPSGYLLDESPWQDDYLENPDALIFHLALREEPIEDLGLRFVQTVAKSVIKSISEMPEIEFVREQATFVPDSEVVEKLVSSRPFSPGDYFVDQQWVISEMMKTMAVFQSEITTYPNTVEAYFASNSQAFTTANRIFFHLVENKQSQDKPFAFLATYANNSARHVPLANSLREYKKEEKTLLSLLSPLSRIAEQSSFVSGLTETGELFKPLALSASEAYTFLSEIPIYEKEGVYCRIPNFWKNRTKHALSIGATVGKKNPGILGINAILDFEPYLMMGGKRLTRKELSELMNEAEGLRLIKGQWVEVNHDELKKLLDQLNSIHDRGEITMLEMLRAKMGLETGLPEDLEITNGDWLESLNSKLQSQTNREADVCLPSTLKAELRPYQKSGYEYLLTMYQMNLGCCLADDMGLGKTVQVIALIAKILQTDPSSSILIVLPKSLCGNWEKELDHFLPSADVHFFTGVSKEEKLKAVESGITITTYGLVGKLDNVLSHDWTLCILDEAQAIKNSSSSQTKNVKLLKSKNRLVLTGTPVENGVGDIWSIFDFLNPGLLGSKKEFTSYSKALEDSADGFASLRQTITPFIIRRMKTDKSIISDLPEKLEEPEYPVLSKLQAKLYQNQVDYLEKAVSETEGIQRKGIVLATILKLKQICNHPDQYSGQPPESWKENDSGKFELLDSICSEIKNKRERVLVFTQFREVIPALDLLLSKVFGQPGLSLDGSTSAKKRTELVKQFNAKEYCPYMILSLKAGGVGLNLTAANHVIHFDRWWNPAVENQATDRAFRIGQTKNVVVHSFTTKGTVEEKIDQLLESKRSLNQKILSGTGTGEGWITELSNEELIKLCTLEGGAS